MAEQALFGRYWEADSVIHRLDPRTKLLGVLAMMVVAFSAGNFAALGIAVVATIAFFLVANVPLSQALRSIAPLSFIIVLTALFNLFWVQGGTVYADWGWLKISQEGVRLAIFLSIRLTILLLTGSLLTLTTTTLDITEAFERLLTPLARIGVPAHEFALILGIALRFLPQFAEELHVIRIAQLSRGAKLATSPTRSGIAGLTSLLVPLFASAFRHADTLASAMDARCYHGAQGRTRLNPLSFAKRDAIAIALLVALAAVTIAVSQAL
jgi:energy-coupling factor transport system permease protein